jgi:(1->4)-alpha-D-glucan 1-alpha-D-glucosylmutase
LLRQIGDATPEQVLEGAEDGLPKLWLIKQGLALRERHPEWFGADADIEPLDVRGRRADHAIAYLRAGSVIAIAPRLVVKLGGDWGDTTIDLPEGDWLNHLTGDRWTRGAANVAELLRRFPVALLSREAPPQ